MKYEILYKKKALKFIQKQPPEQQKRISLWQEWKGNSVFELAITASDTP